MTSPEVIAERLELLDLFVKSLRDRQHVTVDDLRADIHLEWDVEHGLQLCVQCVSDIASHIVAAEALGKPGSSVDAVELLGIHRVISRELAEKLMQAVRFRNHLVHLYAHVRLDVVHDVLVHGLDDLEEFARQVIEYTDLGPRPPMEAE